MLLGDDRKLDPNVAALPSPKEALLKANITFTFLAPASLVYLINHWKCGSICAVSLDYDDKTPQHGGYYLMGHSEKTLLINKDRFKQFIINFGE